MNRRPKKVKQLEDKKNFTISVWKKERKLHHRKLLFSSFHLNDETL